MKSRIEKHLFTSVFRRLTVVLGIAISMLLAMALGAADASVTTQAGPYRVEIAATPTPIALGKARLLMRLTDGAGRPMEGVTIRALTKMAGMSMGEREAVAVPQPGQPGVYVAPAQFAMEGGYGAALNISGPAGTATVTIPLNTGQDTGTLAGASVSGATTTGQAGMGGVISAPAAGGRVWLPWLVGGLLVAFVVFRVWRTGQKPNLRAIANRSVLGGLLLIALVLAVANYAINKYRRPGSMTPLEAQGMQMELPAPSGDAPVELATVTRGRIENMVHYTGQAVGFVEQDVTPRVTGTITQLNVYAGDRVRRGQILARLDTSQAAPVVAGQRAALDMATQGVGVARREYSQSLAAINEAHAEVGMKTGAVQSARADLTGAQDERANQQAQSEAAQSMTLDANAQLQAAQSDGLYWRDEIAREENLLKAGAVTREEYQRERAQTDNADARIRQAQARVTQTGAQIRAAQSAVRKAEAMIASAQSKVEQAQAELASHYAHVRSTEAAADSARQKIAQAQAGVAQARAGLAGASATQAYSEIRAQTDGVVTQRVLSPGVLVNAGQTILRVAQISPIRLQANVAEGDLGRVRVGGAVLVGRQGDTAAPLMARVTSVAPSVDAASRTGVVEAVVPNRDTRFLPGQYVTFDITTGRAQAVLLIPTRAIRYHTPPSGGVISTQSLPFVWIADAAPGQDGQYTAREVQITIGLSDGQNVEVRAGVKEGQKVITAGQDYLKDGDTVAPAYALTASASPPNSMPGSLPTSTLPSATMPTRGATLMPAMSMPNPGASGAMPGMTHAMRGGK